MCRKLRTGMSEAALREIKAVKIIKTKVTKLIN
jgi:hypothetical protein